MQLLIRFAFTLALFFVLPPLPAISAPSVDLQGQGTANGDAGEKRGWWWYEPVPQKEEPKEEEAGTIKGQVVNEPSQNKKNKKLPFLKDYTLDDLWNMHSDDFNALVIDFQKKAVSFPTVDNVKEYYIVQDIARRRALSFTNVTGTVMQMYPQLFLAKDYPTATPGRNAMLKMQVSEVKSKIAASSEDYALIYFYSTSCSYCVEQNNILNFFKEKHRWPIKKVNVDTNPDLASRFGVGMVPYLILISKSNKNHIPVSAGVVALDDLEDKLFRGIRLLAGEITPDEYSLYEYQRGGGFDLNNKNPLQNSR